MRTGNRGGDAGVLRDVLNSQAARNPAVLRQKIDAAGDDGARSVEPL